MKKHTTLIKYVLLIFIVVVSPWTWKLITTPFVFVLVFIMTVVLLKILNGNKNKRILYIVLVLTNIILITISLPRGIDKKIFSSSRLEKDTLARRFNVYSGGLGKIYMNRYAIYYHFKLEPVFSKYSRNLFENMDINSYFFGAHPRENHNLGEYVKYTPLLIPFFVIGFFGFLMYSGQMPWLFVVNLILSALYSQDSILGPFLLYPYITIFITFGLVLCTKKLLRV